MYNKFTSVKSVLTIDKDRNDRMYNKFTNYYPMITIVKSIDLVDDELVEGSIK